MTRAICPACRSAIPLDAALCSHCGLAVRPTCSNCGEVLGSGDVVCRRCREPIDAPPSEPIRVAQPATVAVAPRVATQPRVRRRRSSVVAQLVVIAVVAGVLVTGGLLALEVFAPRSLAPFDLVHRSYPALGFSLSRPSTWRENVRGNVVAVAQPDNARGFRVVASKQTLAAAHVSVAAQIRKPPRGVDPIALSDALTVDTQPAFRYTFNSGGRYVQQWWIRKPGGTFLFEFSTAQGAEADAGKLAEQIVDTFSLG